MIRSSLKGLLRPVQPARGVTILHRSTVEVSSGRPRSRSRFGVVTSGLPAPGEVEDRPDGAEEDDDEQPEQPVAAHHVFPLVEVVDGKDDEVDVGGQAQDQEDQKYCVRAPLPLRGF